jgi:hypothetical protein
MTGIAMVESTYQQFRLFNRYDITELWPNEPLGGGGSHVGLMQIDMKLGYPRSCFWDWRKNAMNGTALFREKLQDARRIVRKIRNANSGLRELTPQELENMALVLYRMGGADPKKQYYRVNKSVSPPVWVENVQGNPKGVAYAKRVRQECH